MFPFAPRNEGMLYGTGVIRSSRSEPPTTPVWIFVAFTRPGTVASKCTVTELPASQVHFGGAIAWPTHEMVPLSSRQVPLLLLVTRVIRSWVGAVQVKLLM